MKNNANLVIRGTFIGSILVILLGIKVTAGEAAINSQDNPPTPTSITAPLIIKSAAQPLPAIQPADSQNKPTDVQKPVDAQKLADVQKPAGEDNNCQVSHKFSGSILQWCELITANAERYSIPPDLIAAMMLQESGGNPDAYSHSGAVGLLQVMPRDGLAASFMCPNGPCFASRPTVDELKDPAFNIEYGTRMLANLINKYGNYRDALKTYGPGDMGYSYANKVLAIFQNYGR